MPDYVLRGGVVVDGTGAPARRADVAITGGRITQVGRVDHATRTIDVDGLTIAPGFIDVHTHYDAQVMWDAHVTPSSWHGVTTIVGGNCGFTIAPLCDASADYVLQMLAVVEGIPYSALSTLDAGWGSFGSWLDRLEGRLAVNTAFFVGHSTLRHLVMGDASIGHPSDSSGPVGGAPATDDQIRRMQSALHEALSQGALGLSTSRSGHTDHHGLPVPSRAATDDELLALCSVVSEHAGTLLNFSPDQLFGTDFSSELRELLVTMSATARRPLFINGPERGKLSAADLARERGAQVVAMTLPHPNPLRLNFSNGLVWDSIPGWAEIMHEPHDRKVRLLADASVRAQLLAAARTVPHMRYTNFADTVVFDVASPSLAACAGRTIGAIAAERRTTAFDALLDIALEDDLQTGFTAPPSDTLDVWRHRIDLLTDPRTVMSGSDAGAHLDMVQAFDCITQLVGPVRRDLGVISLEEAVRQATDVPARRFGLRDRGRVAAGALADVVVFDADTFESKPIERLTDLPGGAWRLASAATGLHHVFVNGVPVYRDGIATGDTPGTVLRSGRDTDTVTGR